MSEQYRLVADENDPVTLAMLSEPDRAPTITSDPLSVNYESAERAARAVTSSQHDDGRDDREKMIDLLTDMFHLCDLLGLDMDHLVNSAQRNYAAEIKGEL